MLPAPRRSCPESRGSVLAMQCGPASEEPSPTFWVKPVASLSPRLCLSPRSDPLPWSPTINTSAMESSSTGLGPHAGMLGKLLNPAEPHSFIQTIFTKACYVAGTCFRCWDTEVKEQTKTPALVELLP